MSGAAMGGRPERVRVRAREYLITYLEDHQRRLEDALHRYDSDRLNMLYGQLASKVKYQLLKERAAPKKRPQTRGRTAQSRPKPTATKKPSRGRTRARTK